MSWPEASAISRGVKSKNSRAMRWTTSPSRCSSPLTPISRDPSTARRFFSNTLGQTMMLAMPVSSSSVAKITPVAVPGRCRTSTSPAVCTIRPAGAVTSCSARRNPCRSSMERKKLSGWPLSESERLL